MAETLSPTFVGMQFAQVADICYTKLNLLLLAMEARKYEGGDIYINPKDKIINPNAIGNVHIVCTLLSRIEDPGRLLFFRKKIRGVASYLNGVAYFF